MYDLHLFEAVSKSHVLTLERKGLECTCGWIYGTSYGVRKNYAVQGFRKICGIIS